MRLVPDSWGSTLREGGGNDCNLPAGASDGGQFGRNDDPRCGSSDALPAGLPEGAHVERFGPNDPQFKFFTAGTTNTVAVIVVRQPGSKTPTRGYEGDFERVIGSIRLTTSSDRPDYLAIGNVNVAPKYQRKGLGAWLYAQGAATAKALGHKGLASRPNRGGTRSAAADATWRSLHRRGKARTDDGVDVHESRLVDSWSSRLQEANDCHVPAGTRRGGQFCSKDGTPNDWFDFTSEQLRGDVAPEVSDKIHDYATEFGLTWASALKVLRKALSGRTRNDDTSRTEAVKKSWGTRRKVYGRSGRARGGKP